MAKLPFWFLCFFVFSLPWQGFIVIPGLGTVSRLLGFLLVGVGGLYILLKKNLKELPLLLIICIVFVLWGLFSYIWSIHPVATLSRFFQNIQFIAMMWLIWELCNSRKDYILLMQLFVLGLFIPIFDMLSMYISQTYGYYRISAGGFGANRMALYLAIGMPIAWYLYLSERMNMFTWFNLSYIPLAMFSILLTGSRTGLIIGAIGLIIVPLTFINLRNNSKIVVLTVSTICVVFSLIYFSQETERLERNIERFVETPEMVQEGRFTGREIIWAKGIQRIADKPIHGYGSNTSRFILGEALHRDARAAHNTYIALLLDGGIISIIILIAVILLATIPTHTINYNVKVFGFITVLILLTAMIVNNIETEKIFWFVLSIFMGFAFFIIKDGRIYIVERK